MQNTHRLQGVIAAAVTPLKSDLSPDIEGLENLLHFLYNRGCHGVLILGTTGEGPSFSLSERQIILSAAAAARQELPGLSLLAGTGTPSLEDTILLTRAAFDIGYEGTVILPPYYFRKASDDGLFGWFSQLLEKAVPSGGSVLGYHIPPLTALGFSIELISRLMDAYPDKFVGIKDSSGDPEYSFRLGAHFGSHLIVFNGNDRLFSQALSANASGCITAMANLISPLHRIVWDNFQAGVDDKTTQTKLTAAREVFDHYPPMPPLIKQVLSRLHGFPTWPVKPPLIDIRPELIDSVLTEYLAAIK